MFNSDLQNWQNMANPEVILSSKKLSVLKMNCIITNTHHTHTISCNMQ